MTKLNLKPIFFFFIIIISLIEINCQFSYSQPNQPNIIQSGYSHPGYNQFGYNHLGYSYPMIPIDWNIFKLELKLDKIIDIEKNNFNTLEGYIEKLKESISQFEEFYKSESLKTTTAARRK
uniref:SXP/RAL-2 family protein Ani s 5-like cation-binding domain-containing protein n=2 Tax=Strongyloides stercoralis TaxID=6248 RepID=A0A0K0EA82_STRER